MSAVRGQVLSALAGSPVVGAPVTLKRDGAAIASAETGEDGAYSFTGIEAGEGYTVEASASIYRITATGAFAVSGNKSDVNILLNRDWPEGEFTGSVVVGPDALAGVGIPAMWNPFDIAFGPDGTLYITQPDQYKILQAAPAPTPGAATVTDFAGTGENDYLDQSALLARFKQPSRLVCAPNGDIYVTDSSAHRIRKIAGGQVTTIAGTGDEGGFSGDNGPAINAKLKYPGGITMDNHGNIYFTDNSRIRKITPSGIITTIAGTGVNSSTGDNGLAVNAAFNYPWHVAVDTFGNLYISEQQGNRVRKIDAVTHKITTAAGDGTGLDMDKPGGLAVAADGTLYIADYGNSRILVVRDGTVSTLIETGLHHPSALAFGPDGYLYVCDAHNRQIVRY